MTTPPPFDPELGAALQAIAEMIPAALTAEMIPALRSGGALERPPTTTCAATAGSGSRNA